MNLWWAPRGTLLIEFVPLSYFMSMFWEEGSVMGHRYWVIPAEGDAGHNIEVPPADVAKIVREQLGAAEPKEPTPHYEWSMDTLL